MKIIKSTQKTKLLSSFLIILSLPEVRAINKLATSKQQTETQLKFACWSFSRLLGFLKDAEQGLPNQLDDAASAMLLAHIIENKKMN